VRVSVERRAAVVVAELFLDDLVMHARREEQTGARMAEAVNRDSPDFGGCDQRPKRTFGDIVHIEREAWPLGSGVK
jgi:hypothetical protein